MIRQASWGTGCGQWHTMFLRLDRCFRQLKVRLRCCSDYNEMDVGILHQLVDGLVDRRIRMVFGSIILSRRSPLDDGCQAEFRAGIDERDVEYLRTEAVSDHADIDN